MKKYIETINPSSGESLFIDPKTGELKEFQSRIVYVQTEEERQRAKEFFRDQKEKKRTVTTHKKYGAFIWNIYNLSQKMFPEIKASTITRIMFLSTYVGYKGYLVDRNRTPLSKQKANTLLSLSSRELTRFWDETFSNGIARIEDGYISFNHDIFKRGRLTSADILGLSQQDRFVTRLYVTGIRELYKKSTVTSHKTLSYLFQIIPFVNRQYNIICHNPLEPCLENIVPMTLGEFCDVIGYNKSNATRLFNMLFEPQFLVGGKLKTAIRYVADRSCDKKTYSMFINPHVYYAGNKWKEVEILAKF